MNVYLVYYDWEPSGKQFDVVVAESEAEAIEISDKYNTYDERMDRVEKVDTSEKGIIDGAYNCC